MIPAALGFVVAALAVARVTRLITTDYLTAGPRGWIVRRLGVDHKLSYLITCQWCTSVWVALPVGFAWCGWSHITLWAGPGAALAMSQITGIMARGEDE